MVTGCPTRLLTTQRAMPSMRKLSRIKLQMACPWLIQKEKWNAMASANTTASLLVAQSPKARGRRSPRGGRKSAGRRRGKKMAIGHRSQVLAVA